MPRENLRILTGRENLALYEWGSRTAKDYFCRTCGIRPFRRPSDPTPQELSEGIEPFDGWTVNVRCIDGLDLDAIPIRRIHGSKIDHGHSKWSRTGVDEVAGRNVIGGWNGPRWRAPRQRRAREKNGSDTSMR
ncbi:MAG: hypothetical protein ACRETB_11855 [Steroidobacteraceae bacterium]